MVELEKQRMQFAKDLEVQRMNMFMDTQVQLERIKHAKRSRSNGKLICSLLQFIDFWLILMPIDKDTIVNWLLCVGFDCSNNDKIIWKQIYFWWFGWEAVHNLLGNRWAVTVLNFVWLIVKMTLCVSIALAFVGVRSWMAVKWKVSVLVTFFSIGEGLISFWELVLSFRPWSIKCLINVCWNYILNGCLQGRCLVSLCIGVIAVVFPHNYVVASYSVSCCENVQKGFFQLNILQRLGIWSWFELNLV